MDNIADLIQAIFIGLVVANFLLNTSRVRKALELCKECLILLDNKALEKDEDVVNVFCRCLQNTMMKGYQLIYDYTSAIECCRNYLVVLRKTGERAKEGMVISNMASLYASKGNYKEAKCLYEKALSIMKEVGDRKGEAFCYGSIGTVLYSLREYEKAKEYLQKALAMRKDIDDRQGEADDYENLGNVFAALGDYAKAEMYLQKALDIRKDVGDNNGEAAVYESLGSVFLSLCEYGKAEKYLQKSLAMHKEIGNKSKECSCFARLGEVFIYLGRYGKAEEYFHKALAISKEIGDRKQEGQAYGNLGFLFHHLGVYSKAKEYIQKELVISEETGDKQHEALSCGNLGTVFLNLSKYSKAEEFLQRSLSIRKKIGDRKGEAACYGNLGAMFQSLDEYTKAKEYLQKALTIRKEIGDRRGEATDYENLGSLFDSLGEFDKARECYLKGLEIIKEIGNIEAEFKILVSLARFMLFEGKIQEAFSNLSTSIERCEEMQSFLSDNDLFKISFLDEHVSPYQLLSAMLCFSESPGEALHVVELGRARALADLMSAQYSTEKQITVNPQSLADIEGIVKNESNCTCLYISYFEHYIFLWIMKANNPLRLRQIDANDCLVNEGKVVRRNVDNLFGNETFRSFHTLPQENCEDRSFFPLNTDHPRCESSLEDIQAAAFRLIEIDGEEEENERADLSLGQCYKMIIAPVADLLEEPEIIIVPDRCFYKVPFAALSDESGKPLSETFRIRIIPSLMTLKFIQDSPADYHRQTGALIVGEPNVTQVYYKGCVKTFCLLPAARKEAEMIGRLLGVQPLLGQQATKQAVLQSIHSVALIHFAAHGNAESGEIALAPSPSTNEIPQEEDYLLSIADVSQVQLRAKLIVLSCCHSASGQVRSEGVVGIARAFLGSGARSVLVALWALEDEATKHFMSRFYENVVRGESASESLHQAMKWMRGHGYSDVRQWAPFMLIGDNVSFDFGR